MRKNRLLQALTVKPFLFLFLAEVVSQVAMNMMNFILIIVAFELTNSNTAVSGIVLSFTIPAILFGIMAGVFVDRWNKKWVLFATNVVRGFLLLILIFAHSELAAIYAVTFLVSIATQFFIPAETPMIPNLVPKDLLLSANALFGIGIYGSLLAAYALSSPFLLFFGKRDVFLALAILYFLASFFVILIRRKQGEEKQSTMDFSRSVRLEIKHAFHLIAQKRKIYHSLILLGLSQVLILIIGVIGPGYAKDVLHVQVSQFPILFVTPAAFGMVIGAVVLDNFFHNASRSKSATVGVFISGFAMLLLPYGSFLTSGSIVARVNTILPSVFDINVLMVLILLAFILGFANALVFVPSNTLVQEETNDENRGKVYGALNSFVGILSLFPIIIVGSLADIYGVSSVIVGIGVVILLIGLWRLFVH